MSAPRGFTALLVCTSAVFAGFSLLLPVVPLDVDARGGSGVAVGASTAIFMLTTVLTQPLTPLLLRRVGYRAALVLGSALLGAPALAMAVLPGVGPVLSLAVVRGVGFGLATVAGAALVAELVPPARLGRATGVFGIAIGAPQLLTLPAGVAFAVRVGTGPVFAAGGVLALIGAAGAFGVPAALRAHPRLDERGGEGIAASLVPIAELLVTALAYGGAVTFLPLAVPGRTGLVAVALAVVAGAMFLARAGAGVVVDRIGVPGGLLLPGGVTAVVGSGLATVAVGTTGLGQAVALLVGAMALGAGFGIVQNDALLLLFARSGQHGRGAASAAFNIAYDAGTGIGAAVLGVAVGIGGYGAAFVLATVLVAVVVPFTVPAARTRRASRQSGSDQMQQPGA